MPPPRGRPRPGLRAGLHLALSLVTCLAAPPLQGQSEPGPGEGSGAERGPFTPDTVLTPPAAPRIVRLPSPGSPVVSLRLSVPVTEGAAEAGAGLILQMLGTERATTLARAVGATVEGTRTPWSIAYTVTGAAADVDFLAFLLREAVRDPAGRRAAFRQALDELEAGAERRQETPGGRIAARLRLATAPSTPPLGGTPGSLARLTLADVRAVWARTHHAEGMTLVVAGDIPLEVLLASFREVGAPPDEEAAGPSDRSISEPDQGRTQVLRHWYGEARVVPSALDPHAEVAAVMVTERLQAAGGAFEAEVQLWQLRDARILAVVGAAYASGRQEMRRRIESVLPESAAAVTPAAVERAVSRLEADVLMRARTPAGRAGMVGLHLDAAGEVGAAGDFLEALGSVTAESTASFLRSLTEATAVRAEIRP